MKTVLLIVACCLLISSCKDGARSSGVQGRAVEIVLKDVTVRQYAGQKERFVFETRKLKLDEEAEVLEAPEGVAGSIRAGAFGKERKPK
jgi:hypothetical protein